MKYFLKTSIFFTLFFIILLLLSNTVSAEVTSGSTGGAGDATTQTTALTNPLDGKTNSTMTPATLIGKVIKGVLGIVGSLALVMFIYGGFTWMTAAGASDKVTKGRDIIVWAVVGLIVIFSAYAGVKFVFDKVLAPPAAESTAATQG